MKIQLAKIVMFMAHFGQRDKCGKPYYKHPLSVADMVSQYTNDQDTICAALLHDVLEDTRVPRWFLTALFGKNVSGLVHILTKHPESNYMEYLALVRCDDQARLVKKCDILHNLEPGRKFPGRNDKHDQKYRDALDFLSV